MKPMTIKQFSEKTKIPISTIYKRIREGILTPCNISGVWYIEINEEINSKFECSFYPKKWVSLSEVAREFGVSRQRLHWWKNKINSRIENNKIYFLRKDFRKFLERRSGVSVLRSLRQSGESEESEAHSSSR